MKKFWSRLQKAVLNALAHDVVNTAKAAAYSGMLTLFPALLVITTLVAQVQEGSRLLGGLRGVFEQFLPPDTLDLLQSYVLSRPLRSTQLLLSAAILSLLAGLGVMLSLMEGFRRAYRLPNESWGFWDRRLRALLLVPLALVPLSVATLVIIFGRQIEAWMILNAGHDFRFVVRVFLRFARWSIAAAISVVFLSSLYHFGTRRMEHWLWVAPGALAGTLIWFPSTLAYGWYVTRISDYSRFYGSFGAGIATLVWLYLTAFSVLIGAEINGVLYRERQDRNAIR
jgi:membrane protein